MKRQTTKLSRKVSPSRRTIDIHPHNGQINRIGIDEYFTPTKSELLISALQWYWQNFLDLQPFRAVVGHLACYTHPFAEWTRYWQMTTKGFMGTYKWRYYQTARKYLVVNCSALASRLLVSEDYLNYDQLSPWVIWFMDEFDGSKRGLQLNRSNVWLLCGDWWCVSIMCISKVYIYRFYRRCINAVIKFVRKYRINI